MMTQVLKYQAKVSIQQGFVKNKIISIQFLKKSTDSNIELYYNLTSLKYSINSKYMSRNWRVTGKVVLTLLLMEQDL